MAGAAFVTAGVALTVASPRIADGLARKAARDRGYVLETSGTDVSLEGTSVLIRIREPSLWLEDGTPVASLRQIDVRARAGWIESLEARDGVIHVKTGEGRAPGDGRKDEESVSISVKGVSVHVSKGGTEIALIEASGSVKPVLDIDVKRVHVESGRGDVTANEVRVGMEKGVWSVGADRASLVLRESKAGVGVRGGATRMPDVDLTVGRMGVEAYGVSAESEAVRVALREEGREASFQAGGTTMGPVSFGWVSASASREGDGGRAVVAYGTELTDAEVTVEAAGGSIWAEVWSGDRVVALMEASRVGPDWDVMVEGRSTCEDVMAVVPSGAIRGMGAVDVSGNVSGTARVRTGEAPEVELAANLGCRVHGVEGYDVRSLSRRFSRTVITAEGGERKEESGPGSGTWVPASAMSRFLIPSLIAMEDMNFPSHGGIDLSAVRNSARENLREGRFARGASTITMQLAKNVWLGREKSFQRKAKEAVLALLLEEKLTKGQIVELYANVVEFTPGEYGISNGARRMFGTSPDRLSLSQCLVLASSLPNPKSDPFTADGKLRPGRARVVEAAMRSMAARGMITEDDLQEGLEEVPRRGEVEAGVR